MEITTAQKDNALLVTITGTIDAMAIETLSATLSEQIRQGKTRMVADFGQVDYINSAGLRALLVALKDTQRKGGDFRLAGVQENVKRALELAGFTSLFKIFPDAEAGVASYSS
ncbi:MAG: STAS domain-containing protein [Chloroflexi bacterium]|nr:STAS domain-containing protein [Chloroflexota bacterium]